MTLPPGEGVPSEASREDAAEELRAPSTIDANIDWTHPDYRGHRRHSRSSESGHTGSGRSRAGRARSGHSSSGRRTETRHRWYRPRNVVGIPVLVLVLLATGFVLYLNAQLAGVRRAPLLPAYGGPDSRGTNLLLVGSEAPAGKLEVDVNTLVIQLVHLSEDGRTAVVTDLPRDLYLPAAAATTMPGSPAPRADGPHRTLVGAYRHGGVPEIVQVVQEQLGLDVRHAVQVGFGGYVRATDRIGGADLGTVDGVRHVSGAQALAYADAPGITSVQTGRRHQAWIKAMLRGALMPSVVLNPFRVAGLVRDTTPYLIVDDTLTTRDMRGLLWRSRHQRADTIVFLTAPSLRYTKAPGAGTVLVPDARSLRQLGTALRTDDRSGVGSFRS